MAGPSWRDAEPRQPDEREPDTRPFSIELGPRAPAEHARGADRRTADGRGRPDGRGGRRGVARRRAARWWGTRQGRLGVLIVIGCAALGAGATVAASLDPGTVLGALIFAGTVAAAFAVRRSAVYQIIPVPALAYLVAALAAGLIHDPGAGGSRTMIITALAQWFASGFLAMVAATAAAIAITVVRRRRPGRGPGHHAS